MNFCSDAYNTDFFICKFQVYPTQYFRNRKKVKIKYYFHKTKPMKRI